RIGLPKPYKAYKNRFCEDTNSSHFVNPLKRYRLYTAANCLEECAVDKMVALCGCRAFNDAGNDTICSALEMLMCYIPNRHRSAPFLIENVTSGPNSCHCPEECNTVTYTAALSYADFSSDFEELQLSKAKVYPNVDNLR
ncbi:acid-sensing ion channel 1-like, partial [Plakobranchus ocellatus]